jgi:hypothetical protein
LPAVTKWWCSRFSAARSALDEYLERTNRKKKSICWRWK